MTKRKNQIEYLPEVQYVALFAKKSLKCLFATYEEDSLVTGRIEFESETRQTGRKFETKPKVFNNIRFARIYVKKLQDGL